MHQHLTDGVVESPIFNPKKWINDISNWTESKSNGVSPSVRVFYCYFDKHLSINWADVKAVEKVYRWTKGKRIKDHFIGQKTRKEANEKEIKHNCIFYSNTNVIYYVCVSIQLVICPIDFGVSIIIIKLLNFIRWNITISTI